RQLHLHSFPTRRSSDLKQSRAELMQPSETNHNSARASSCCRIPCMAIGRMRFTNTISNRVKRKRMRSERAYLRISERGRALGSLDRKSTRLNSSHVKIS